MDETEKAIWIAAYGASIGGPLRDGNDKTPYAVQAAAAGWAAVEGFRTLRRSNFADNETGEQVFDMLLRVHGR